MVRSLRSRSSIAHSTGWHGIQSLAISLGGLVRTWWQQDRIRASRSCGQLLSLSVGDRLLIGDRILLVVGRNTEEESPDAVPVHVEYWLRECDSNLAADLPLQGEDAFHFERLIVPIAVNESIRLYRMGKMTEYLSEELVILSSQ